ncbi:conserved Plasmodium protein, unknown function [Plasmodium reichenowi]|uniref:Homeobox-containing protein n=1 Tax=Plasmodium reichenowi TaxID=5854 RepID=A0A2P9DQ95_PLARE|nr:conserved Plasmodium protein, unknown function [Plasmodium reichenowi]
MDSLFTININPDENVSIKKGKDNIKKYSKEGNDEEKSEEDDKLINFNINEISDENTFEMLGDLNENQIKQFINVRKNIRKYILKSFKKDQIINGRLENSEIEFLCDENKKNNDRIKLILRKDIINNVINNFTKDKQKRNKANDMNNRYFYLNSDEKGYNNNDDDDNYNEEEEDEKNFMDLFMDTDMFEKKINEENERVNQADINDDKKLSDKNEDDDLHCGDKNEDDDLHCGYKNEDDDLHCGYKNEDDDLHCGYKNEDDDLHCGDKNENDDLHYGDKNENDDLHCGDKNEDDDLHCGDKNENDDLHYGDKNENDDLHCGDKNEDDDLHCGDKNENDDLHCVDKNENDNLHCVDKKNEYHDEELAIVISKNSDEDNISVKNDNRSIEEKCIVPKTFNKVLFNFEEIIKNWKLNFPDINTENLFFHLFFLSELYKEKRYICQNCGSIECEKDPFMKTKCLNNFCFLCHKHISENMCHNTRSQYVSFKSHMSSFNDYTNVMYPYNYIPCLSCFTRKHMKCGFPPYIFAKNTYCYRKDYSFKSNRPYVLYMNNPLYIWDISNDKKNRIVDSTKNDNDISVINIKEHKYNTLYNHDKISDIYSIDDYDSDYYDHDLSFKNENEKNNMYENETFDNDIQKNKKKRKFSSYNLGNHNFDKMLNKKSRDDYNHDDIRKNFHYDNKHTNYRKEEDRNYSHKNKYNISYNNKYDNNINNKYNKYDENKQYTNDYLHSDDRNYVRNSVYEKKKNSLYMNNHNARNNNNDHYNLYNNNNNNKYNNQEGHTSGLYKYKKSSKNISHNHVPQNSFNNLSTTSNKNNNKHNSSHNYEKKYSWNPKENGQYKNNNNKKKPENNHRKASGLYKNVY